MIGYATPDDLLADPSWIDSDLVPGDVGRYLRSASLVVAKACQRNPYTDVPTGTEVRPLADATCAQAASWLRLGVDPAKLGLDGPAPVKSSTILGAKVDYDTTAQAAALVAASSQLAPEAEAILQAAGLLWVPTPLYDPRGAGLLPTFGLDVPTPSFVTDGYAWPGLAEWPFY